MELNKVKAYEMIKEIILYEVSDFNTKSLYYLIRKYRLNLPFHSETLMKDYRKRRNDPNITWSELFRDILMDFTREEWLDLLNTMLFYLHAKKVNHRKLKKLELYLDTIK